MFDKMVKMRNRKGFTLVEMLVVIAVIAILSSLVIPMFSSSTTKANAAANAANLRSVKGEVATMLVVGQITYEAAEDEAQAIADLQERIDVYEENLPWTAVALAIAQGEMAVLQFAEKSHNTYYASDEKLDIDGITLSAPAAKPVNIDGLSLRKGTEMTVTITDDDVIVSYAGVSIDVLAAIAESGDFTTLDMTTVVHLFTDSNGDGICDICNNAYEHSATDKIRDTLENVASGAHSCYDTTADCICDDENCGLKIPCVDYNSDYTCDNCGVLLPHDHYDDDNDGVCDVSQCEESATHEHVDDDTNYNCDKCGDLLDHTCFDKGGNGVCDVTGCGKTVSHSCIDEDKNCDCDYDECSTVMHSMKNHVCSKCKYIEMHTAYNKNWWGINCDYCGKSNWDSSVHN